MRRLQQELLHPALLRLDMHLLDRMTGQAILPPNCGAAATPKATLLHLANPQIILTFASAYSCYYVAEDLLGASGLLAVVCNGFTASLIGGRQVTARISTQMHAFWGALEWVRGIGPRRGARGRGRRGAAANTDSWGSRGRRLALSGFSLPAPFFATEPLISLLARHSAPLHSAAPRPAVHPAPAQVANTLLFLLVGIALGIALLPPKHPLLSSEVVIAHHLSAVDAGYCVVLYLWMLVWPPRPGAACSRSMPSPLRTA
jgi:hypothetical protein